VGSDGEGDDEAGEGSQGDDGEEGDEGDGQRARRRPSSAASASASAGRWLDVALPQLLPLAEACAARPALLDELASATPRAVPVALMRLLLRWWPPWPALRVAAQPTTAPPTTTARAGDRPANPAVPPPPPLPTLATAPHAAAEAACPGVGWRALCERAPAPLLQPLRPLLGRGIEPSAASLRMLCAQLRCARAHADAAPNVPAPSSTHAGAPTGAPTGAPADAPAAAAAAAAAPRAAAVAGEPREEARRVVWVALGCAPTADWHRFATLQMVVGGRGGGGGGAAGQAAEMAGVGGGGSDEEVATELVCWVAWPSAAHDARRAATAAWARGVALPAVRVAAARCDGPGATPALGPLLALPPPGEVSAGGGPGSSAGSSASASASTSAPAPHHLGVLLRLVIAATVVAGCPRTWLKHAAQLAREQAAQRAAASRAGDGGGDDGGDAAARQREEEEGERARTDTELLGWAWSLLEYAKQRHGAAAGAAGAAGAAVDVVGIASAALELATSLAEATSPAHHEDAQHALRRFRSAARGLDLQ